MSTIYKNILLTYYGSVSEHSIKLFHAGTVHLKSVRSNVCYNVSVINAIKLNLTLSNNYDFLPYNLYDTRYDYHTPMI